MTILDEIVAYKASHEIPERMAAVSLAEMQTRAQAAPPALDFVAALRLARGVALIAEIKRASPSKGLLCPNFDPLQLAAAYAANGAAAVSVLTDERFFQGHLDYLTAIRRQHPRLPLLRKDFIVDPYQVYEARAAGADALLLIAAVLPVEALAELLALTHSLGMTALIEVHDRAELERVLPLAPRLVGVNNRNLHDFKVSLEPCLSLRPLIPAEMCCVAESGIHTPADVARLAEAGIDAMLIGEALVTAQDVAVKIKELTHVHPG
jgi:indole-3-glycerol phosphate synthase